MVYSQTLKRFKMSDFKQENILIHTQCDQYLHIVLLKKFYIGDISVRKLGLKLCGVSHVGAIDDLVVRLLQAIVYNKSTS